MVWHLLQASARWQQMRTMPICFFRQLARECPFTEMTDAVRCV